MLKKPVRLEKIFLLNVLLYVDSLESIKKFIEINKKCQEVSTMVRLYTKRREKDSDDSTDYENKVIPKNLFTIFPKIETIECDLDDLNKHPEIMEKTTFIRLKQEKRYHENDSEMSGIEESDNDSSIHKINEISNEIKNKVVSIICHKFSDIPSLDNFIYCRKLSISSNLLLKQFEQIKKLQLDKLIVYQYGCGNKDMKINEIKELTKKIGRAHV